jgi:hypothetical protein
MTPIKWVHRRNLHDAEELKPLLSLLSNEVSYMVPVFTLDQIEAWLEHEQATHIATARYGAFAYLLAKVKAWKEGK